MPRTDIATDSANELRDVIGDDSTATFEDDPAFVESNPPDNASTESVAVQRDTDDVEDSEEEIEEADEEEDEDLEDEEDLENDEDVEDEDDEEEDEDDEDEEDEDEEDDADEVADSNTLWVDGQLGHEEVDQDDGDVTQGVDEDELDANDMDTDTVTEGWPAAALRGSTPSTQLSI